MKIKAYKLAGELGVHEQALLDWLKSNGYPNARRSDTIRAEVAQAARLYFKQRARSDLSMRARSWGGARPAAPPEPRRAPTPAPTEDFHFEALLSEHLPASRDVAHAAVPKMRQASLAERQLGARPAVLAPPSAAQLPARGVGRGGAPQPRGTRGAQGRPAPLSRAQAIAAQPAAPAIATPSAVTPTAATDAPAAAAREQPVAEVSPAASGALSQGAVQAVPATPPAQGPARGAAVEALSAGRVAPEEAPPTGTGSPPVERGSPAQVQESPPPAASDSPGAPQQSRRSAAPAAVAEPKRPLAAQFERAIILHEHTTVQRGQTTLQREERLIVQRETAELNITPTPLRPRAQRAEPAATQRAEPAAIIGNQSAAAQLDQLRAQHEQLRAQHEALKALHAQALQAQAAQQATHERLQFQNDHLKLEGSTLRTQLREAQDERDTLDRACGDLRTACDALQADAQAQSALAQQYAQMKARVEQLSKNESSWRAQAIELQRAQQQGTSLPAHLESLGLHSLEKQTQLLRALLSHEEAAKLLLGAIRQVDASQVERLVLQQSVQVCAHPVCNQVVRLEDKVAVRVDHSRECQICQDQPERRWFQRMAWECRRAGVRRILVVGGGAVHPLLRELSQKQPVELRLLNEDEQGQPERVQRRVESCDLLVLWSEWVVPAPISQLYADAATRLGRPVLSVLGQQADPVSMAKGVCNRLARAQALVPL